MTYAADVPRPRRAATLASVAILHLAAVMLVASTRHRSILEVRPLSLTVMSLAREQSGAVPPPSLPSKRPAGKRMVAAPSLSTAQDATATQANVSGCATLDQVSKAIVTDPAAVAAVMQAPSESRSVADAIVIWNAGWSEPAAGDAPLEPVRRAVVQSLAGIDDNCLEQPVVGPRFIPVPEGERTLFLVFGSGAWSWKELLASDNGETAPDLGTVFAGR